MDGYDNNGSSGGWPEFAAVILFAVAFFRVISAITYFANSHKLNDLTNGLFSSHNWGWGVWDLIIAALAVFAGMSLIAGGMFGRVVAYTWAIFVIVQGFTTINLAPWYSAFMIALAVMVIYGLARTPREAAP